MNRETDLLTIDESEDEVLRVANALYEQVASGTLPPNVVAAIGAAMTVLDYGPSEWDTVDTEEVLIDCCAALIRYSITFTRHLNEVESEPLVSEGSRIAVLVFGQLRAEVASQRVADEYKEMEEEFQEQLGRPTLLN